MTASADPDFAALRARFPTLVERVYFATHCLGPVSIDTLADLDDYRRTFALRNRVLEHWIERLAELRTLCGRLVGVGDDDIAFGPNATALQGNFALAHAPTPERDAIVVSELDFPSSRYVWEAQAARGFRIVRVPAAADGIAFDAAAIARAIDGRTAIVAVPLVSYANGARLDLAPVVAAARAAGALVVVDAYQAVGIVPIDVRALDVDALVGGMHKWLGAPSTGIAFLYVRRALADRLSPAAPGWFGHANGMEFARAYEPAPGARRFEQGSPAMEAVYTGRAGVKLALATGVPAMLARSQALGDRLIAAADRLGIPLHTPRERAARGGVVCLGVRDPDAFAAALAAKGIDADTRPGTGIRLSAHPGNTEDDCDRVIAELAAWQP